MTNTFPRGLQKSAQHAVTVLLEADNAKRYVH